MSAPDDDLHARQAAFAAHLRDARNPPPPGIEPRRMAVYRELFRATIQSLLAANFPVIRATLGDVAWATLVDDFHREHRCVTPLFPRIGGELIDWLSDGADRHPPWLPELAHYEWMELRALIDDTPLPPHAADGDLLAGAPLCSPQAWPLAYAWPVDRIGPAYRPAVAPAEPTLLLVRRDAEDKVRFARLSPLAFRLLQMIGEGAHASGGALLDALAVEAGLPGDAAFERDARAMLQRLREEGTVIGTRAG